MPCVRTRLSKYSTPLFPDSWLAENYSIVFIWPLQSWTCTTFFDACIPFMRLCDLHVLEMLFPYPVQYPWPEHLESKCWTHHWRHQHIVVRCSWGRWIKITSSLEEVLFLIRIRILGSQDVMTWQLFSTNRATWMEPLVQFTSDSILLNHIWSAV